MVKADDLNTNMPSTPGGKVAVEMKGAPIRACSFCGKDERLAKTLVDGPSVSICNECVTAAMKICAERLDILKTMPPSVTLPALKLPVPPQGGSTTVTVGPSGAPIPTLNRLEEIRASVASKIFMATIDRLREMELEDGERRHINPKTEAESAVHCAGVLVGVLEDEIDYERRRKWRESVKTTQPREE